MSLSCVCPVSQKFYHLLFRKTGYNKSVSVIDTVNVRREPERGISKGSSNFRRKPERGINKGSKITPPPPVGGGFRMKGGKMSHNEIKPGYVYHIKNLYFDIVKDELTARK